MRLRPTLSSAARPRDERGIVLSTRLLALSVSAVAMAALVFVANDPDEAGRVEQATTVTDTPAATATPSATPTPSATATAAPAPPPIDRKGTLVVIFNNTGVTGLAKGVAATAEGGGWDVAATENWYGTIDTTSVYYPANLQREAEALATDLGISSVKPSVEPMRVDRLTVILTDDYQR